jgi:tetratricopeptide (TPR) repeat protein
MRIPRPTRGAMLASVLAALPAFCQQPRNLQADMQAIAQALGVNCEYCHSAPRGSNDPEPRKDIARQMIAMTRDINTRVQSATGKPAQEATAVTCATCHHGVPVPKPLTDVLRQTLAKMGVDAAVAQYKSLREQFYGAAAYDFSEAALINLAQPLSAVRPDDAIALLNLNLTYYPKSAKTYAAIAYAYTRKFDDATAIKMLEKSLEIEPDNGVVQGQLAQLKMYQRRK